MCLTPATNLSLYISKNAHNLIPLYLYLFTSFYIFDVKVVSFINFLRCRSEEFYSHQQHHFNGPLTSEIKARAGYQTRVLEERSIALYGD